LSDITKRSGRKGPGRSRSQPRDIIVAERHAEWLKLRLRGWTFARIAQSAGVHQNAVWEAVTKELRAIKREPAQELLELELQALDDLIDRACESVEDPEKQLELIRKIRADRRKMLGLDAPTRSEVSIQSENLSLEDLRALLRPLGWDVVPLAVEVATTAEEMAE